MKNFINKCSWCGKVSAFLTWTPEVWLQTMCRRHKHVTEHTLPRQQIRAWQNSFKILQATFRQMGERYKDLYVVFEYCLPQFPPKNGQTAPYTIRADAVLVSADTAVVLEFKDRPDAIIEHARAARKYRNRLQNYHVQSRGMRKWSVLIPTMAKDLRKSRAARVTACSPDRLAEELMHQFGEHPKEIPSIVQWRNSAYEDGRKQERK